jgi:hypothetical protein
MSQIEVVHESDHTGRRCARCHAEIAATSYSYAAGERVVVIDEDPLASWRTQRSVTCTTAAARPRLTRGRAA